MSVLNISSRYALALINLAEEKGKFDEISTDVEFVTNTLEASRELRKALVSPVIKVEKKLAILDEIFKNKIGRDTETFIKFVLKKNRENFLLDILKRFIAIRKEKLGLLDALVTSAVEFSDVQKEEMKKRLEKLTNKKVQLEFSLDEKLIGGFLVKFGDSVVDATVHYQLEKLKKSFLE